MIHFGSGIIFPGSGSTTLPKNPIPVWYYLLKCRKVRKTVAVPVGATKGSRRPRLVERIVHFGGSCSGRRWPVGLGMGRPGFRGRRALRGRGAFRRGRLLLGRKSGGGGGGGVSGPRRGNRRCVIAVLYNDDTSEKKKDTLSHRYLLFLSVKMKEK
jgi:hypothetical protein